MSLDKDIKIPKSIAIILDGNGRYAKKNNLPVTLGHKAGCDNLETILEESARLGVKYLYVYAFSTENWKRSEEEKNGLFDLFFVYLNRIKQKAIDNKICCDFIGDLSKFSDKIQNSCKELKELTKDFDRLHFIIAFNYGARDEIVRAVNKILTDNIKTVDEQVFADYLDTKDFPDPDLLIRTSGEKRISNFMLWQIAYSEIYITDVLWPEFNIDEYHKAIIEYNNRERRYGGRTK